MFSCINRWWKLHFHYDTIFFNYTQMQIKKDFNEISPNFSSSFLGNVIMDNFFLFDLSVFSKCSIIIIKEIHNKYTVNIFLMHWLVLG